MNIPEDNINKYNFEVEGGNFDDAGTVSTRIKSILKKSGLPTDVVRKSAIVSYEAEINIVSYAKRGTITLTITPQAVVIEVIDEGPGIPNIVQAMEQGYSTADKHIREMGFGAGMGLFNIKSYSDNFDISSTVDIGTFLKMTIKIP